MAEGISIGAAPDGEALVDQALLLRFANRHGLIAGATGTGKTVTLQVIAEGLSEAGVPVFLADVKGDLAGLAAAGVAKPGLQARAQRLGLPEDDFAAMPAVFWDVFGEQGHRLRATISDLGPLLLARLLGLTDAQQGVLTIAFALADREGLLLLDLKDLRALLSFIAAEAKAVSRDYGLVSTASVAAVQRKLLALEQQGADAFFGEPALVLADLIDRDGSGRGVINILAADQLIRQPATYGVFLVWLLSELFEELPEIGDPDRPVLVLVFDEAHLIFHRAPAALVDAVANVVRLIRSKGVGVMFVTQNPADLPEVVLGQLGNRVQHGLRAYTPAEQTGLRAAAQSFRVPDGFDTAAAIQALGVGEALVSLLDDQGAPGVARRTLIRPPRSRLGPLTAQERAAVLAASPHAGRYDDAVDRDSAFEMLARRAAPEPAESARPPRAPTRAREGLAEAFAKSAARAIGSRLGREILRGVLGSISRR